MAANMIGVKKRVIIVNMGFIDIVMFNPVLLSKDTPYETEEGCLSLTGVRKTTRYENIEVEYYDMNWKNKTMLEKLRKRNIRRNCDVKTFVEAVGKENITAVITSLGSTMKQRDGFKKIIDLVGKAISAPEILE